MSWYTTWAPGAQRAAPGSGAGRAVMRAPLPALQRVAACWITAVHAPTCMCSVCPRARMRACMAAQRRCMHARPLPQVMYKRKAEREADTTMDLSVKCVEAARYRITMTDTPGAAMAPRARLLLHRAAHTSCAARCWLLPSPCRRDGTVPAMPTCVVFMHRHAPGRALRGARRCWPGRGCAGGGCRAHKHSCARACSGGHGAGHSV